MALEKVNYVSGQTIITAKNLNDIQDAVLALESKDGVGMGITGATVGQIAKVAAVDASGVPTAWEPVDMASGGGGETWEKLVDASLAESVDSVTYTFDNCKKVKVLIAPTIASGEAYSGWTRISINNVSYPLFNYNVNSIKGIYFAVDSVYPPYVQASLGTNSNVIAYGFIGGSRPQRWKTSLPMA
jgi:hypothetical protein